MFVYVFYTHTITMEKVKMCSLLFTLHMLMLRCQAQLGLTLMMCLSDRSTFWRA
jgi:hypothetical protein